MDINADFNLRVVLHGASMAWVDSPVAGVQRRMLDRIGDEVARATSIVRYAAGSQLSAHTHGGGEEVIVLGGDPLRRGVAVTPLFEDERETVQLEH